MQETESNKKVASKRIFQFLNKNPAEVKARAFFMKSKMSVKPLTTIFEDTAGHEAVEIIPDSPGETGEGVGSPIRNSPFNSSFTARYCLPSFTQTQAPSPVVLARSGSLSPRSIVQIRKNEETNYKARYHLPMTGTQALLLYEDSLTETEKKEIVKYEQVYFFGNKVAKLNQGFDDDNGGYKVVFGDHLAFRYEILELLGKGTFGQVYKCLDYKRDIYVAVKILRKTPKIRSQGDNEIKNLELLNSQDPEDSKFVVRMLQCFEFRRHLCISFELLSSNLYQFLRKTSFKGLNLNLIKRISLQILLALRYIHSLGLTHCDLKLENILLKNEGKSSIKVIDLGSAITYMNPLCNYIQSRYYRAPEVILGAGYDNKIDIWSFGCIVVELYTGRAAFTGENEHDQLLKIMAVLGVPPRHMLEKCRRRSMFFFEDFRLRLAKNKQGSNLPPGSKEIFEANDKDEILFKSFALSCLQWEPSMRFSAEEALKHPWIKGGESRGSGETARSRLRLLL